MNRRRVTLAAILMACTAFAGAGAAGAEEAGGVAEIDESLVFAVCDEYVNVRTAASTDSDTVARLYNHNSAMVVDHVGDWYEILSGDVHGYVKSEYFAIGEKAAKIANEVAYNVAVVYPDEVNIHVSPDESTESIDVATKDEELEVVAYEGDWMKVALGGDVYGYVNAYYVGYKTYYPTAEALDEPEPAGAVSAEEEADSKKSDESASEENQESAAEESAPQEAVYTEAVPADAQQAVYTDVSYTEPVYADTAAAGQTYADPVYTDTTYTDAAYTDQAYTDTTYTDTAYTQTAAADTAYTDTTYTDTTYTDAGYTDTTYTDTGYTDTTYTDTGYTDTTYTDTTYTDTTTTDTTYTDTTYTDTTVTDTADTGSASDTASAGTSGGAQIVSDASNYLGNPYVWGGTSLTTGADCSGFTQAIYAENGISIPRTAAEQAAGGTSVDVSDVQAGDLLFYSDGSGISHVAIYAGDGQVIHSANEEYGVITSNYDYDTPVAAARYW